MKFPGFLAAIAALPLPLAAADLREDWRMADSALNSQLWELSGSRFEEILKRADLTPEDRGRGTARLAESLIHTGESRRALALVEASRYAPFPERLFWKAQALAGLGRFEEAVASLDRYLADPSSPFREESALTRASLQLSLDQPQAALDGLARIAAEADPALVEAVRLRQAEVLLDLGRVPEARAALPEPAAATPARRLHAKFIEASILLKEGKAELAGRIFADLLDTPRGQSIARYHAAALGLADALEAQDQRAAAVASLLDFIQKHQTSPRLEAIFSRLLRWLPAHPASDDPVIEHLTQWIPPLAPPAPLLIAPADRNAIGAWPTAVTTTDLAAFALFTKAIAIARLGTPEALDQSLDLLARLRLEYAGHFLASRAWVESGRILLRQGEMPRAFTLLDGVREIATSPSLRGEASFLEGKAAYQNHDMVQAIRFFEESASTLTGSAATSARANAALARLRNGENIPIAAGNGNPADEKLRADLELERALSATPAAAALAAIEEFLTRHAAHPRTGEARLAAAEAALACQPPNLNAARAQLEAISILPAGPVPPARLGLVRLRMLDQSNERAAVITEAKVFLQSFPEDPGTAEASFALGRAYFQNGSYNDALLVFEKLAGTDVEASRIEAAWLLAARSAALVGTPQSQAQALPLFDKVIAVKGPLEAVGYMEKGRLLIDMNRIPEATAFLRKWFDTLPADVPLRLPAGLLLGEAIYSQGSGNPLFFAEALAIYDQLLSHAITQPALMYRLQYLRGRILEQLPRSDDPSKKRESEAFAAYYSVIESAGDTPPAEWKFFELCGFRSLALLEKSGSWLAAIKVAEKIASFGGPGAADAANSANRIRLENNVWED